MLHKLDNKQLKDPIYGGVCPLDYSLDFEGNSAHHFRNIFNLIYSQKIDKFDFIYN